MYAIRSYYDEIDLEKCTSCKICVEELGCPAITLHEEVPKILQNCTGCSLCESVCPFDAVVKRGKADEL